MIVLEGYPCLLFICLLFISIVFRWGDPLSILGSVPLMVKGDLCSSTEARTKNSYNKTRDWKWSYFWDLILFLGLVDS